MNSFPNWKAESAIPEWIDGLGNVNIFDLDITDLYTKVANAYPKVRFAQYNSAFDADQERYYVAMGGERKDWSPKMQTSLKAIRSESENFRYYLATGPIHCIHPYGMMFERDVAGTKYTTWLGELISGAALPDDVACTDQSCSDDPICNACAMGGEGNWCGWCD